MNIYLINLDRSPERLARMTGIFSELGLRFARIAAVDGRSLGDNADGLAARREGMFYRLGPGEVGCFLSHRKFWKMVASGDARQAVVFEDDIHFGEGVRDILLNDEWVPADADVVKLETTMVRTLVDKRPTATVSGRSVRRLRGTHSGTCGYVVTREGARKLLQLSESFVDPVDQFMFNTKSLAWPALKTFQLDPAICIQDMILNEDRVQLELQSTLKDDRPAVQRLSWFDKLLVEAIRPLRRGHTLLSSRMHGYSWDRVSYR